SWSERKLKWACRGRLLRLAVAPALLRSRLARESAADRQLGRKTRKPQIWVCRSRDHSWNYRYCRISLPPTSIRRDCWWLARISHRVCPASRGGAQPEFMAAKPKKRHTRP